MHHRFLGPHQAWPIMEPYGSARMSMTPGPSEKYPDAFNFHTLRCLALGVTVLAILAVATVGGCEPVTPLLPVEGHLRIESASTSSRGEDQEELFNIEASNVAVEEFVKALLGPLGCTWDPLPAVAQDARVTVRMHDVPWRPALMAVLDSVNLVAIEDDGHVQIVGKKEFEAWPPATRDYLITHPQGSAAMRLVRGYLEGCNGVKFEADGAGLRFTVTAHIGEHDAIRREIGRVNAMRAIPVFPPLHWPSDLPIGMMSGPRSDPARADHKEANETLFVTHVSAEALAGRLKMYLGRENDFTVSCFPTARALVIQGTPDRLATARAISVLLDDPRWYVQGTTARPERPGGSRVFTFAQICDPQLGFGGYEEDVRRFEEAVIMINSIAPDFVVICGDLVQDADEASFAEFNRIRAGFEVPCHVAPGNHDVGNEATADTLARYRDAIGHDFYAFEHKGCTFVVVNTQLWKSPVAGETVRQDRWVETTLAAARARGDDVFMVGHHPLFLEQADEAEVYANLPPARRVELLDLFREHGVLAVLGGHTHRLVVNTHWDMQMVNGESLSRNFDERPFGFRLWRVGGGEPPSHTFVALETP